MPRPPLARCSSPPTTPHTPPPHDPPSSPCFLTPHLPVSHLPLSLSPCLPLAIHRVLSKRLTRCPLVWPFSVSDAVAGWPRPWPAARLAERLVGVHRRILRGRNVAESKLPLWPSTSDRSGLFFHKSPKPDRSGHLVNGRSIGAEKPCNRRGVGCRGVAEKVCKAALLS
ncbi:MAG: hypothetical protein F9B45_22930 [Phycisphaera sp. RhM]|nr:hypothetical protein [Phycisphaera sp. RhM]